MEINSYELSLLTEIDAMYYAYQLQKIASFSPVISGVTEDDIISNKVLENNDGTEVIISNTLTNGIIGISERVLQKNVVEEYGIYTMNLSLDDIRTLDEYLYNEYGKTIQESRKKYWLEYIRKEANDNGVFSISLNEILNLSEIKELIPILFELEGSGRLANFNLEFVYTHAANDINHSISLSGAYMLDDITKDRLNTQYELAQELMRSFATDKILMYTKGDEIIVEATYTEDSNKKFSLLRLKYPYAKFSTKSHNQKNSAYTIEVKHKLKKY